MWLLFCFHFHLMPSFNVVAPVSMTSTVWHVSVLLLQIQSSPVDAAMFIIAEKVLSNVKWL